MSMSRDFVGPKNVPNGALEALDRQSVDSARVNKRNPAKEPSRRIRNWWRRGWSMPGQQRRFLGWPATIFILTQGLAGIPFLPYALFHLHSDNPPRFARFLAVEIGRAHL